VWLVWLEGIDASQTHFKRARARTHTHTCPHLRVDDLQGYLWNRCWFRRFGIWRSATISLEFVGRMMACCHSFAGVRGSNDATVSLGFMGRMMACCHSFVGRSIREHECVYTMQRVCIYDATSLYVRCNEYVYTM